MEAPEREAAILELSITLHDASLRAKSLAKNVPEMCAVVEAVRHADIVLNMVWDLQERATGYRDSILDLDWGGGTED